MARKTVKSSEGDWTYQRSVLFLSAIGNSSGDAFAGNYFHTSKIYDGMKSEYWIYVPAQYDPQTPAALMVFQDGGGYIDREGNNPALNVIDNLIAQKKIPVMICVFINPGDIADSPGTPTYNFVKAYGDKWQRTLKDSMRSHALRHRERPLWAVSAR